jgi:hypothetical protein
MAYESNFETLLLSEDEAQRNAVSTKFFIASITELKTGICIFSFAWVIHDCSRVGTVASYRLAKRCSMPDGSSGYLVLDSSEPA